MLAETAALAIIATGVILRRTWPITALGVVLAGTSLLLPLWAVCAAVTATILQTHYERQSRQSGVRLPPA